MEWNSPKGLSPDNIYCFVMIMLPKHVDYNITVDNILGTCYFHLLHVVSRGTAMFSELYYEGKFNLTKISELWYRFFAR